MNTRNTRYTPITRLAAVGLVAAGALAGMPAMSAETSLQATLVGKTGYSKRTLHARCDQGRSLNRALKRARPGTTIVVHGICNETVVIATDRLTIKGGNGAVVDGSGHPAEAVILADGVRGLVIKNLSVINGLDQGLLAQNRAVVSLDSVTLTGHATVGLSVDRSDVEIIDVSMSTNGSAGMDAYTGSTVLARGNIVADSNGGDGIAANGKTFLELRGASISASQNGGSGISIINDSRLQIFSFPEAQGSSITANDNVFAGIGLLGSELGVVGSQFFGSGANVITANNNLLGFFMPAGAILSPHATARFVAEGNRVGMVMEDGASALIVGGLNISGNGAGVAADGAGTVNVVSVPPNPSFVDTNLVDFDLAFGSRVTLEGVSTTEIICDPTALLRGSASCP